jgi:hypothetical protein
MESRVCANFVDGTTYSCMFAWKILVTFAHRFGAYGSVQTLLIFLNK